MENLTRLALLVFVLIFSPLSFSQDVLGKNQEVLILYYKVTNIETKEVHLEKVLIVKDSGVSQSYSATGVLEAISVTTKGGRKIVVVSLATGDVETLEFKVAPESIPIGRCEEGQRVFQGKTSLGKICNFTNDAGNIVTINETMTQGLTQTIRSFHKNEDVRNFQRPYKVESSVTFNKKIVHSEVSELVGVIE